MGTVPVVLNIHTFRLVAKEAGGGGGGVQGPNPLPAQRGVGEHAT